MSDTTSAIEDAYDNGDLETAIEIAETLEELEQSLPPES